MVAGGRPRKIDMRFGVELGGGRLSGWEINSRFRGSAQATPAAGAHHVASTGKSLIPKVTAQADVL